MSHTIDIGSDRTQRRDDHVRETYAAVIEELSVYESEGTVLQAGSSG